MIWQIEGSSILATLIGSINFRAWYLNLVLTGLTDFVIILVYIWAGFQHKVQVGMNAHQSLRSAYASAQSDQSLPWALYG